MGLDIGRETLVFLFLLIFVTHAISQPTIYIVRYKNPDHHQKRELARHAKKPIDNLLNFIKKHDDIIKDTGDTCVRLFGSIHGTKEDRLRCLEKLKKTRLNRGTLEASLIGYRDPNLDSAFVDFTRGSEGKKYKSDFSTDYIDFDNLRVGLETLPRPFKIIYKTFKQPDSKKLTDLRKYDQEKRMTLFGIEQRASTSSEDSDDSDDEVDRTSMSNLKRFQVIGNDQSSSDSRESLSEENDRNYNVLNVNYNKKVNEEVTSESESSVEKEPLRKKLKKNELTVTSSEDEKPLQKEHKEDISESSSVEVSKKRPKYVKPLEARDFNKKELYLQGNKLIDLSGRRRLKTFLPKRFHWTEDDIHHLGYYWFNGPHGKYP